MSEKVKNAQEILTSLPSKRFFSIGEISKACGLKPYVLRYWEQEFEQLAPIKRNSRRYYQKDDLGIIVQLQDLLHVQRYTIHGAREYLNELSHQEKGISLDKIDRGVRIQDAIERINTLVQRLESRIH